jgi:hypothetical protein
MRALVARLARQQEMAYLLEVVSKTVQRMPEMPMRKLRRAFVHSMTG